ncbi:MAG: BatA domain-containing protein [Planctomycetia bacterium]|nr:BatA domain-containing protein [Planctomycetia bacterium]
MSFLAPWFVVAGIAAVSLPILFHLFRRTPRDRLPFSTLMFLAPSPPRVTSRSRLENWPLLLLRALVLVLLALAFGRPLLRELLESQSDVPVGSRTVLLIDTSASMRRGDLWTRALKEADAIVAASGPHDEIAVLAFDATTHRALTFETWRSAPLGERAAFAQAALSELKPSWSATRLDFALTAAAEELDAADDEAGDGARAGEKQALDVRRSNRIVLISDLQAGSRTTGLQSYEWPKQVELRVVPLALETANAGLHALETTLETDQAKTERTETKQAGVEKTEPAAKSPRVLVTNAADSKRESFDLVWQSVGKTAEADAPTVKTYVPPGQTRIVRSPPLPAGETAQLVLRGDEEPFDNDVWFVPPKKERLRILHLATEKADDPQTLRYFLERAFSDAQAARVVVVETIDPAVPGLRAPKERDLDDVALVVVATEKPISEAWNQALAAWIERGGAATAVLESSADAAWRALLPAELAEPSRIKIAAADRAREYALMGVIDFKHPIFAPLADPRFSDFTKIRFWRHRKTTLDDVATKTVRVLARFDDGDPAVLEVSRGSGRIVLFASGWQPRESQLGVSSKFIPLMTTLVDLGSRRPPAIANYETGATIDLAHLSAVAEPAESKSASSPTATPTSTAKPESTAKLDVVSARSPGPWIVRSPAGRETTVGIEAPRFAFADGPGIYEVRSGAGLRRIAVNVPAEESKTAPLAVEALESLGVRLAKAETPTTPETIAERQTLQVREMESRQQLWRWCLAAALGVIVIETWYAGRVARRESVA